MAPDAGFPKKDYMNKLIYTILAFALVCAVAGPAEAGNPDRQGEAGAGQLLLNPYPRSAGLHTMNTAFVSGVEAMHLNVAGIGRIGKTEIQLGHALYLQGTDIRLNGAGVAQKRSSENVVVSAVVNERVVPTGMAWKSRAHGDWLLNS